jgi:hypothetical protein
MKYCCRDRQRDKVSSSFREDNPDTNIPTGFALSAIVILSILCDFTMRKLFKIVLVLKSS